MEIKDIDLLSQKFVSSHTKFNSIEELLAAGGFTLDSHIDDKIGLDNLVKRTTRYSSWDNMIEAAAGLYVDQVLGSI